MSGGLAWAMVEPSTNSTIEWITEVGWTITVMSAYGTSYSSCASITSRALLTRVAELIVTTGPMFQVGWARACSGVTSVNSSRRRPRNGPPLAVTINRRTSGRVPERRHWASAECSESTGTICPGRVTAAFTTGPPATSDSLLAKARVRPARSAASVGARPSEPTTPLSTTSHGHSASSAIADGPARILGIRKSPVA
ncbi:hypothetical protein GCM10027605_18950 [Micromonospora zhanjiangensis]